MHMPEPSLILWIVGAPFLVAIVDVVRTFSAIRSTRGAAPGIWSKALHVDQGRVASVVG